MVLNKSVNVYILKNEHFGPGGVKEKNQNEED